MDDSEKKENKINNRIHRLKKINKLSKLDSTSYLIKYFPKNSNIKDPITCRERELNLIKKQISKESLEKCLTLIQSLNSNNFIKIYEYFEFPKNIIHIITESYSYDLSDLLKSQFSKKVYLSENIIVSFFTQILLGVKILHDKNILHRNINPSNIVLISNKIVKISNFNFLRTLFNMNERSVTFIDNSWKEYMSPEMIMNIPYSFKNDIWALGVLLFHMMTLKLPFSFKQLNDIQVNKKVDKDYLYNRIPKHYSKEIKNLCIDLLKAFPAERPDINTIFMKYKIFSNKINNKISPEKKVIKNKVNNDKIIIKNNFKDFCSQYVKFCSDKKIIIKIGKNIKNKEKEKENKKEHDKTKDNFIDNKYIITGDIISLKDNLHQIDINKLINGGTEHYKNSSSNNNITNSNNNTNSKENSDIFLSNK